MSLEYRFKAAYAGLVADRNMLPAHHGAQSIEGFTWTLSILSHYAATGKIRTRGNLSDKISVYMLPHKRGSYVSEFIVFISKPDNIWMTSILGSYVVATVGQCVNSLIVSSIQAVCGKLSKPKTLGDRLLEKLPSGDREALIDRIEPSMKRVHHVVGDGVERIDLTSGRTKFISLDSDTKDYLNESIEGETSFRSISISAFNANTGNGSAFLLDTQKSVAFRLDDEVSFVTNSAISYSLDRYVNKKPSYIQANCTEILSTDGRIKKLIVHSAKKAADITIS